MNTIESSSLTPAWLKNNCFYIAPPQVDKVSNIAKYALLGLTILSFTLLTDNFLPLQLISCAVLLMVVRKIIAILLVYKAYTVGKSFSPFDPRRMMEYKEAQIDKMAQEGFQIYERFFDYSNVRYSVVLIMHSDNLDNPKWILHSLGAGWEWENLITYYGKQNHQYGCNTLLVNGPGVSLSSGWPTRDQIVGAVKAGLYFLENIAKATHIILHGSCLGSAIASEAMLTHDFKILEERPLQYLVISHVAFSYVTTFIESVASPHYKPLIHFSGVEFDGIAAARVLSSRKIKQIVIQHISHDGQGTDGLVKDRISLATHLHKANMPHKVYLESEELIHNRAIPHPLQEMLDSEIFQFLASTSNASQNSTHSSLALACGHPKYSETKEYYEKHIRGGSEYEALIVRQKPPIRDHIFHYVLTQGRKRDGTFKKYVPVLSPMGSFVVLTDPAAIETILRTHRFSTTYFEKSPFFQAISHLTGDKNLLTSQESFHRKLVRAIGPAMGMQRLKSIQQELSNLTEEMVEGWLQTEFNQTLSITDDIHLFVISTLVKIYLANEKPYSEFFNVIKNLQLNITPLGITLDQRDQLDQLLLPIREGSLLAEMQKHLDSNGRPLFTESEILSVGKMLLFSGTDTTSSLLLYLIYILGQKPEIQHQLQEEYRQAKNLDDFIANNRLLHLTVQEGLRLNPSVSYISRRAKWDLIIANKYFIPKGWGIIGSTLWLNRNTKQWGTNAGEFDPYHCENRQPKFVFGGGAHLCFGRHLATLSVKYVLAMMISQFTWKSENPDLSQTGEVVLELSDKISISLSAAALDSSANSGIV